MHLWLSINRDNGVTSERVGPHPLFPACFIGCLLKRAFECHSFSSKKYYRASNHSYSIFLNFEIKRGKSDFEQAGRFCFIAVRLVEHLDDVVALHALQVKGIIGCRGCLESN